MDIKEALKVADGIPWRTLDLSPLDASEEACKVLAEAYRKATGES